MLLQPCILSSIHQPIPSYMNMATNNVCLVFIAVVFAFGLAVAVDREGAAVVSGETRRLVNAVYVFGDSLVDVGNNNFLKSPAVPKARFPYGIDFPSTATGRFTNGYNLADVVAQRLGFKMSPEAYCSMSRGTRFLLRKCKIGANYASGGSGILDTTGNGTLTMTKQIKLFKSTVDGMLCTQKQYLLSQSLFLLSAGGNDFSAMNVAINDAPSYVSNMVSTYIGHIKALYDLGARMVGILDVPPIGCTPGSRCTMENGRCNDGANFLAQLFNNLLRMEMAGATAPSGIMPSLKYSVASNYNILSDLIANPFLAGLKEVESACCGAGKLNAEVMCSQPNTKVCLENHNEYMFWDMLHGTQATYQRGALAIFYGATPKYADPINFSQLVNTTKAPPSLHADE